MWNPSTSRTAVRTRSMRELLHVPLSGRRTSTWTTGPLTRGSSPKLASSPAHRAFDVLDDGGDLARLEVLEASGEIVTQPGHDLDRPHPPLTVLLGELAPDGMQPLRHRGRRSRKAAARSPAHRARRGCPLSRSRRTEPALDRPPARRARPRPARRVVAGDRRTPRAGPRRADGPEGRTTRRRVARVAFVPPAILRLPMRAGLEAHRRPPAVAAMLGERFDDGAERRKVGGHADPPGRRHERDSRAAPIPSCANLSALGSIDTTPAHAPCGVARPAARIRKWNTVASRRSSRARSGGRPVCSQPSPAGEDPAVGDCKGSYRSALRR